MQNISPIKKRILQYIDTLGISKRDFYVKTGISRGTLESNTGITEETVAKFIAVFPEISPGWLLTGIGAREKLEEVLPGVMDGPPPCYSVCRDCKMKDEIITSLKGQVKTLERLATRLDAEISSIEVEQKRKAVS